MLALHDEVEQAATRVDDQSDKRSGGIPSARRNALPNAMDDGTVDADDLTA